MPAHRESWTIGRVFLLVTALLAAVALVLLVIAGAIALRTRAFIADSITTQGTVVQLVARESCSRDDDGDLVDCGTVYAPRVRFTAADGRVVAFTSDVASSRPSYLEGDVVTVRYRAANPAAARIDSFTGLWLGPVIVGGIGLAFAAFAVLWAVLSRVARRSEGWQDPGTLR